MASSHVEEGSARIKAPQQKVASKKMPVFYNPVMRLNRDISIVLLNCIDDKEMQIGLPVAASGIRGIRLLKEASAGKISRISMNDISEEAVKLIKDNLKISGAGTAAAEVENKDANAFLLDSKGFDYIDLDPFGSPNFMLDAAVKRIARSGILAVTATDTGCLCGTFREACARKYWAKPLGTAQMHEWGLRMLIRKVQLIGAQYDKALKPVFAYSKHHYFRAFFRCQKGRNNAYKELLKHKYALQCPKCLNTSVSEYNHAVCPCGQLMDYAGPLYAGRLWDQKLASCMHKKSMEVYGDSETTKMLGTISEEADIDAVGFFDIHELCKAHHIGQAPKLKDIIAKIKEKGFKAAATHFRAASIRSDISIDALLDIIRA